MNNGWPNAGLNVHTHTDTQPSPLKVSLGSARAFSFPKPHVRGRFSTAPPLLPVAGPNHRVEEAFGSREKDKSRALFLHSEEHFFTNTDRLD